jgi:hydrogenase expression/formation protein HypD
MKHVDEYRNGDTAQKLATTLAREVDPMRDYRLMEFCGGHTHAIFRYGVQDLLPGNVKMIHGPGCPVCVLPISRIDQAIAYARRPDVILCSYGDMLRVPGSKFTSLMKAKAEGCDVRMVYSTLDALELAQNNPDKKIVFFAIGFETTTPPTAMAIKQAKTMGLKNFFILSNHVLTPSAIQNILESPDVRALGSVPLDGFLGPAHVSVVIGSQPYEYFVEEFQRPVVISGFEPLDVMQSILMLVRQLNEGRAEVENQYLRAVTPMGNTKAKKLVAEIFELRRVFEWRGLGEVPYSGLRIKEEYADFDAEVQIPVEPPPARENKACECPAILRGMKKPTDCKLFGIHCTPENPMGSCMVSAEGACAAYYSYGRFREAV